MALEWSVGKLGVASGGGHGGWGLNQYNLRKTSPLILMQPQLQKCLVSA